MDPVHVQLWFLLYTVTPENDAEFWQAFISPHETIAKNQRNSQELNDANINTTLNNYFLSLCLKEICIINIKCFPST